MKEPKLLNTIADSSGCTFSRIRLLQNEQSISIRVTMA
jgi:hypothetical protein